VTNVASGAPQTFGSATIARTTAKATLTRFQAGWMGADHEWKIGGQLEKGGHDGISVIPTGVRYVDRRGQPSQSISSDPSHIGAQSVSAAAFATDALTLGQRLTINIGLRFDHTRAFSQDLSAVDLRGQETGATIPGRGTLYTWNLLSPRLGLVARLSADGRTMLRASYGRFSQGVLTGELEPFHPGSSPTQASRRWSTTLSTCDSIPTHVRRTPTSTPSASIEKSVGGCSRRSPMSTRMAPTSSGGRTLVASI
jgi:hypothetical protein